ncbi:MAG: right-handed parallel beta-helix repeat-containing protein, partial [Gracilimonas sp.]
MRKLLLSIIFGIFISITVNAQTTVSDTLTTSDTWTVANSPYQVTSDVIIAEGVTLTIEPGVEVQFDSGTSLLVDGALVADGTAADSIRFTSSAGTKAPGDWNTIRFNNTSNVGSVIDYVIMEYGGAGSGGALLSYTTGAYAVNITNSEFKYSNVHGIDLRASSPDIENSTFRDNNGYGIFSDFSLSYTVDSSTIIRNGQGGIRVPINAAPTITASVIDTNGTGIYMDNGSTADVQDNNIRANNIGIRVIEAGSNSPLIEDNSIEGNSIWGLINEGTSGVKAEYNYWGARSGPSNLTNPAGIGDDVSNNVDFDPWLSGTANLPVKNLTLNFTNNDTLYADTVYVVSNNLSLASNDTLYIEPGTNIKFESGRYMTINGTMYADGKVDSVIAFTSITDDVYGGDTNGDGRNSMPQPGEWNYLRLSNSGTSSVLNYVNVRYAGSGSTALRIESPSVQLTNMFVDNNQRTGISITAVPVVFENIVSNANGDHGFEVSTTVDIKNIVAQRNNDHGLFVDINSGSSFVVSIDSSEFSYNTDHGVYIDTYSGATAVVDSVTNSTFAHNGEIGFNMSGGYNTEFYFVNNTVEGNNASGAHLYMSGASTADVEIFDNTFLDNSGTGLRTSAAKLYNNHFEGNNFGLGIWGLVEFDYENLSGTDDNTFSNNRYSKALELNGRGLKGTLSASLPADISDGGSYMFNEYTNTNVNDGQTLTIEPGTLIKMLQNQDFTVAGTLIAQGTAADSIKFTSYRDDKINNSNNNPVSDTTSAQPRDHYGIYLTNPDTDQTVMEYVVIKYADDGLRINSGGSFANDFNYLTIQHSYGNGIEIDDATLTIDNSLIENSRLDGIHASSNKTSLPTGELTVRNSIIRNNGDNGIENGRGASSSYLYYSVKELSNTTISGNSDNGIKLTHPPSAVSFVGNTIEENGNFGAWIYHRNMDLNDISIAGNMFRNNGKAGIRSSSAKFIDNTFDGNEFGISIHGKLGYRYVDDVGFDGNVFTNNTYNNALEFYPQHVKDTLSSKFPEQITSGVYMMGNANGGVINNDTLFIDEGVIIKGGHDSRPDLDINSGMILS